MGLGSWLFGGAPAGSAEAQSAMDNSNQIAGQVGDAALGGMQAAQGRQGAQVDYAQNMQSGPNAFLADQRQALGLAQERAMGQNTVAEQQFRQAANRNVAQQAAMAQAGRGNAALAQRTALNNQANVGSTMAGDAAMAASQEANQYAGLAGQLAGQYGQMNQQNQQFNAMGAREIALANQQREMQQRQMNDQYQYNMGQQGMAAGQQGFQNQMRYNEWLAKNKDKGMLGALGGAAVGLGTKYLTSQIGGQAVGGGQAPQGNGFTPPGSGLPGSGQGW